MSYLKTLAECLAVWIAFAYLRALITTRFNLDNRLTSRERWANEQHGGGHTL